MQKLKKIEILPLLSVGTEDELSQIITTAALLDCDKISSLCLIVVHIFAVLHKFSWACDGAAAVGDLFIIPS